ncbi:MAG: M1 family metallopeptidase, partial [Bacteroidota bacterium]
MKLDVKFNTRERKVIGNVKYDFKPLQFVVDTIYLNAPGIEIKKVLLDGKENVFKSDSNGLTIRFAGSLDWNKQYKLEISYEATPRKGLYFLGWDVDAKNATSDRFFTRKQIWTQGQGIDNRHWIPCYDEVNDKMITETVITFDTAYTVVSNGVLKEKKRNTDGTFTWYYTMNKPMVPYLLMIAIDKFAYKDYKSKNGMTSRQYYYADRPETVEATYQYSSEMMDWLSQEFGVAYPWQVYSNTPVQDFMYGAMENTTATIYGDFYLCDNRSSIERPYISTNAHELTHQWFGDYITEYSATHHWLHESFATYYAKQFIHQVFGEDRYESDRRGEQWSAITADRNDRYPVAHSRGGSNRHYSKGSAVIDMIRYVVGDSVFKKCVTNYLKKHAYGHVLNEDFKMTFMETAGLNLDWFFDQWVYRAGYPEYGVKYEVQDDRIAFYVEQTHKTDELTSLFKMPIVFEVHFKDGSVVSKKEWISHAKDTVYINAPAGEGYLRAGKQIEYALFDPGSNIIKTVYFPKSFEELAAQAEKASHMIDRSDAIGALRDTAIEKKRDLLIRVFNKGNYHTIQNDIIAQLSEDTATAATELLLKALRDNNFLVRRAVIDHLETIPASFLREVEHLLYDTSYYTIEMTLRKLCKNNSDKLAVVGYLASTDSVYGINNNVHVAWLEISAAEADSSLKARFLNP